MKIFWLTKLGVIKYLTKGFLLQVAVIGFLFSRICYAEAHQVDHERLQSVNAQVEALSVIQGVTLIDPESGSVFPNTSLVIRGKRISFVGPATSDVLPPVKEANVVDGSGLYAIPGLIDSHVHVASVPGSRFREDSRESLDRQQEQQLISLLAAGFTTVLDPAAAWPTINRLRGFVDLTGLGPTIIPVGPVLTPPSGYISSQDFRRPPFDDLWPPIASKDEVIAAMEHASENSAFGIKVAIETGFGPFAVYEIFSEEMLAFIAEQARARNLKIFVHSMSNEAHATALKIKPDVLVHVGFYDTNPSKTIIAGIREQSVPVISTTAIYDLMKLTWDTHLLSDQRMSELIPQHQLQTISNPDSRRFMNRKVTEESRPRWVPGFIANLFSPLFFRESLYKDFLMSSQNAVASFHEAEIPIVLGSDSGNWPVFTSMFHGYGSLRELELLAEAGLDSLEVLRSATIRPAKMLGKSR